MQNARPNVTNLESQLREDEGEKLTAYKDSKGLLTIGVGILIDSSVPGAGITKEESTYLLRNRIASKTAEVERALPWVSTLSAVRKSVLINMAFQMGTAGLLGFKNTLAAIEKGQWQAASVGMLDSKWARTDSPNRAQRLAKQMLTGVWQ